MASTIASRKAKGRRACQEARELLIRLGGLEEDDIVVKPSGVNGEDLYMSPAAQLVWPFTFEVKNHESLNIWEALKQAEKHAAGTGKIPLLLFKRNSQTLRVCLDFEAFLHLLNWAEAQRTPAQDELPHLGE